jgi:hypothetical protein
MLSPGFMRDCPRFAPKAPIIPTNPLMPQFIAECPSSRQRRAGALSFIIRRLLRAATLS